LNDNIAVWLVEDDEAVGEQALGALSRRGFEVTWFRDGSAMHKQGGTNFPDIFLIDINLPGQSGIDLTRSLRRMTAKPIILITGRADVRDRVEGLESGADDYIIKPVHYDEVVARIHSNLRRSGRTAAALPGGRLEFGNLCLDSAAATVTSNDGHKAKLSPGEARLLAYLLRHANTTLSRAEIFEFVHGRPLETDDKSVDVYIHRLRKVLSTLEPDWQHIKNERGKGFRMEPSPKR
jgi:two-component system response regulator PhoP